jgi:AraC-like DNA-binding protein
MDYATFASDLPADRIVFHSAEENQETMRRYGVKQEVRQIGRGKFRCDMAVRATEHADLYSDRFNRAFSMRLEPPEGTVGLVFLRSASGHALASGENAANDQLVVLPDGKGTDIVAPDLAGSEALTVPKTRFIEMTEALCPTPKSVRPDRMAVIRGDTARLHALRKAVVGLIVHPEQDPHQEQLCNLLAATIAWMGHSSSHWRPEGFIVNGARTRAAKRAQQFIEEHYREAVRMEDLCRATGVGARTLQRGFREHFDLSITDYLKAVRLDAARRELVAAQPSQHSVTAIALRNGFSHLGRFSVKFHERFAESPRETLARERVKSGLVAMPPKASESAVGFSRRGR